MAFRRFEKDLCAAFCWLQHLVLSHITGYIRFVLESERFVCTHPAAIQIRYVTTLE